MKTIKSLKRRDLVVEKCVYCAIPLSVAAAATLEHMPPKILFTDRQRPAGFEFPCCARCNRMTSDVDICTAWIACAFSPQSDPAAQKHASRLSDTIAVRFPELMTSLAIKTRFKNGEGEVDMDHYAHKTLQAFATKAGLALHWHETGRTACDGVVSFLNFDRNTILPEKALPPALEAAFPTPQVLRQGNFTSAGQFARSAIINISHSFHLVYLRDNLALLIFVNERQELPYNRLFHKYAQMASNVLMPYPWGLPRASGYKLDLRKDALARLWGFR